MTTATAPAPAHSAEHARGTPLTGTGALLRFALRRDRVRIPVWLLALTLGTAAPLFAFLDLYGTSRARQVAAETMRTPAGLAFTGPEHYLSDYHFGAILSHQMLGFVALLVGIMSVLMVTRHTRSEEETGRAELVRGAVVGRHAHLASALILAFAVNVALALLLALSVGGVAQVLELIPDARELDGITWPGSLLYGAAHAAAGITFAGVAAVAVQMTQYSRGASGLGLAIVGVAYLVRAGADSAGSDLSWASPIGWAQQTFAYLDNRWWPLLLNLAAAAALAILGFALSVRRDLGAGLRPPRRGRPTASRLLTTPFGFALRLHRGMLIGFAIGLAVAGMSYGPFLGEVEAMFEDVDMLERVAQAGGASFVDSFITMIMTVLAIIAAVYVVIATLRPRAEEGSGRAEPVLATGLSRTGWLGTHLAVAMLGGPFVLLLGGLTLAVTGAPTVDDPDVFGEILWASAVYIPALWVIAGVAVVLVGWLPRAATATWLLVVYAGVVGYFGKILQFPDWMNDLSPFGHVPQLPVDDFEWTPLIALTAVAAGLVVLGLVGFRRRDLETK